MAEMVVSALVQEGLSRAVSFVLSKQESSREHIIERLEMAHTELELAIERSRKFPLTDRSLLHRRKILKHAFEECGEVLYRTKLRVLEEKEMPEQRVTATTLSSFPKRITHAVKSSVANLFTSKKDDLSCSDVQRFGWLADCASKFVRDVESGCSLRQHTFCNPLVRHLLEGKTLMYEMQQGCELRRLYLWPVHLEERGVEAQLRYWYVDRKVPDKNFDIDLLLRLSESTDMAGIAIKSLRSLTSLFNLAAERAMGELTLLANLHDMSHSYSPPWVGIEESHNKRTYCLRPDPVCCKESGHKPCVSNIDQSELSEKFPEQVISFSLKCCFSELQYNLHSSSDESGTSMMRDRMPPLEVTVGFVPHTVNEEQQSYALERVGDDLKRRNVSIEEVSEMARSNAIKWFSRQPDLIGYGMLWASKHGSAGFIMQKPSTESASVKTNRRYRTRGNAKRSR